jgi:hypothetical protein
MFAKESSHENGLQAGRQSRSASEYPAYGIQHAVMLGYSLDCIAVRWVEPSDVLDCKPNPPWESMAFMLSADWTDQDPLALIARRMAAKGMPINFVRKVAFLLSSC